MTLKASDASYLNLIRNATLATLTNSIGKTPQEIILLDTPRHRNLGDTLIWQGTIDYIEKLGHKIVHQSDLGRHRDVDFRKFSSDSIVLMQGGGNMGDLYPEHDRFRRHIIATNPKRRIVVLPQSIYYQNAENFNEAVKDYHKGSNVTLMLRESRSLSIAQEHFSELDIMFCHDLALGADIGSPIRSKMPSPLVLARKDNEAMAHDNSLLANSTDWSWSKANGALWHMNIAIGAGYKRAPALVQDWSYTVSQKLNDNIRKINIGAAVQQFSPAPAIATNRLHAHVLAVLLGIPHVVTDNSYGKISRIYNEYSGAFSTAHWADTLIEATEHARSLVPVICRHEAI